MLDADAAQIAARVLAALAGPGAALRSDQQEAVSALLAPGARVLLVQATGWGKSAVYWVTTAVLRERGGGPTLVVSPLLSLMRDQVAAAERAGLRAASINSANVDQWHEIEECLHRDLVDVVLVSPERLASPGFGERVLDGLAGRLGLLVVDEAHAVSDWGHDFRPDYRRVADVLRRLNPQAPVLATTATANARVTQDVAAQLGAGALVLRGPLARESLELVVLPGLGALERYAWVVHHLAELPGSGIVYTLTVADAERLTEAIRAVHGDALPVAAYTGALDAQDRVRLEDALRADRVKALVATSALGMGFDKPNLGFVVHVGSPPSPVSYYQQVGRAGRRLDHALVALLPSPTDDRIWEYFATASLPDEGQVGRLLAALPSEGDGLTVPMLEAETGLRRTRVELLLKQLAVDGATQQRGSAWLATGLPWHYDHERYDGIRAVRRREAAIMREYVEGRRCLMALLQEALDDPQARPCGRCSVCAGGIPPALAAPTPPPILEAVRRTLRGQEQVLEPRKMWPGGMFGRRGRIGTDLAVEPGRVLVHMDAPEWEDSRRGSLAGRGGCEEELLQAAVDALVAWRASWAARPEVVVSLATGGLPGVALAVAERIADVGRLTRRDWEWPGEPPDPSLASAAEATAWRERLVVPAELAEACHGRAVLLVVDATASGWPVTVGGAAIRAAGARLVLPLVVHRRPG